MHFISNNANTPMQIKRNFWHSANEVNLNYVKEKNPRQYEKGNITWAQSQFFCLNDHREGALHFTFKNLFFRWIERARSDIRQADKYNTR